MTAAAVGMPIIQTDLLNNNLLVQSVRASDCLNATVYNFTNVLMSDNYRLSFYDKIKCEEDDGRRADISGRL